MEKALIPQKRMNKRTRLHGYAVFFLYSFLEKEQGYVFVNKNHLALLRAKEIFSRWSQIFKNDFFNSKRFLWKGKRETGVPGWGRSGKNPE